MDMSNLLIASDDEEIVMRQNTTWLTLQLSWGYRNLAQLMENGLDVRNMSMAEDILACDYTLAAKRVMVT